MIQLQSTHTGDGRRLGGKELRCQNGKQNAPDSAAWDHLQYVHVSYAVYLAVWKFVLTQRRGSQLQLWQVCELRASATNRCNYVTQSLLGFV